MCDVCEGTEIVVGWQELDCVVKAAAEEVEQGIMGIMEMLASTVEMFQLVLEKVAVRSFEKITEVVVAAIVESFSAVILFLITTHTIIIKILQIFIFIQPRC